MIHNYERGRSAPSLAAQDYQGPRQLPTMIALKLLYLAIKNAGLRWWRGVAWTAAMGQFAIQFGARFPGSAR
jgi:hypothetical protein